MSSTKIGKGDSMSDMARTEKDIETLKTAKADAIKVYDTSIKELQAEINKNGWNRRCAEGEKYYYTESMGGIDKTSESGWLTDEMRHERFNYFPCSDFTVQELIDAGMPDAGTLKRGAFKKCKDDWMSEDDRANDRHIGWTVYRTLTPYCDYPQMFVVTDSSANITNKWINTQESAEAFAAYLNDKNNNYKGVKE